MAFHTLGKPKELNFQLWLKLSEKFMKDPVWWCGLWCFFVIIITTPVLVFDLDFDWGVAKINLLNIGLKCIGLICIVL